LETNLGHLSIEYPDLQLWKFDLPFLASHLQN
jgi:hypothetical protein